MSIVWSPRQEEVFRAVLGDEASTVVVPGPVQSGKSLSTVYAFMLWSAKYSDETFLLASRTRRQLDGAVLSYADKAARWMHRKLVRRANWYEMRGVTGGVNRYFMLVGGDKGSEEKARSYAAQGALLDEVTLLDRRFVDTVMDRLSRQGAKAVLACNPAGPTHWVKTQWVDRAGEDGIVHIPFRLADNPSLSQQYVAYLDARHFGGHHKRMVLGEWAATSGAIYPHIDDAIRPHPDERAAVRYHMGLDWAHSSVTHAVLTCVMPDGVEWAVDEWRWDHRERGTLTDEQQADRIVAWLAGRNVSLTTIDGHAPTLRKALHDRGLLMQTADKIAGPYMSSLVEGVSFVRMVTETGRLLISRRLKHLCREMRAYEWDEKAAEKGIDRPMPKDDHGCDALRYDVYTRSGPRRRVKLLKARQYRG